MEKERERGRLKKSQEKTVKNVNHNQKQYSVIGKQILQG